jgi:hypothetical protein
VPEGRPEATRRCCILVASSERTRGAFESLLVPDVCRRRGSDFGFLIAEAYKSTVHSCFFYILALFNYILRNKLIHFF